MTRAGDKLYREPDNAPEPSGPTKMIVGAIVTLSGVALLVQAISWMTDKLG